MTEHSILFSDSMVCALLGGSKTQTRRIVKPQQPAAIARKFRNNGFDRIKIKPNSLLLISRSYFEEVMGSHAAGCQIRASTEQDVAATRAWFSPEGEEKSGKGCGKSDAQVILIAYSSWWLNL